MVILIGYGNEFENEMVVRVPGSGDLVSFDTPEVLSAVSGILNGIFTVQFADYVSVPVTVIGVYAEFEDFVEVSFVFAVDD